MLTDSQTQRHGQSLLILKTAGIELGPELHLQLTVLLLRKLKLCHTALQLQGEERQTGGQISESLILTLPPVTNSCLCSEHTSLSTATVTSFFKVSQDTSVILSEPLR